MIFTKAHLQLIIEGKKTQTRRIGKRRWHPGNRYSARTHRFQKAEYYIRVDSIYRQPLYEISEYDAQAEGGYTSADFIKGFLMMHMEKGLTPYDEVWVIHFRYDGGRADG